MVEVSQTVEEALRQKGIDVQKAEEARQAAEAAVIFKRQQEEMAELAMAQKNAAQLAAHQLEQAAGDAMQRRAMEEEKVLMYSRQVEAANAKVQEKQMELNALEAQGLNKERVHEWSKKLDNIQKEKALLRNLLAKLKSGIRETLE